MFDPIALSQAQRALFDKAVAAAKRFLESYDHPDPDQGGVDGAHAQVDRDQAIEDLLATDASFAYDDVEEAVARAAEGDHMDDILDEVQGMDPASRAAIKAGL